VIELVLAVVVSPRFYAGDHPCPLWMMVVGNPSSGKTDSLLGLKGSASTYFLDAVSANSLLSGYVDNRGKAPKEQVLDTLNGKTVVFKDLTTFLSGRDEHVKAVLGTFTSIYDGEYAKATGTLGVLRSKSIFSMVACVTPDFIHRHHQYMAQLGSRFLFIRIPPLTEAEQNKGFECQWNQLRQTEVPKYAELVSQHIEEGMQSPIQWEAENDEAKIRLQHLARLIAHGRGQPIRSKVVELNEVTGREQFFYEMTQSQVEEPFRVMEQLKTLGRALAWIHGRTRLTGHEFELLRRVAISSIAPERVAALALIAAKSGIDRDTLTIHLGRSASGVVKLLQELHFLGLVGETTIGGGRRVYEVPEEMAGNLARCSESLDHIADLNR
jgi:hypothetical protein